MKGIKAMKIGLAGLATGLALAGGLILAMQAFAASGTLGIDDGTAAPGGSGDVNLSANVGAPGLGAWTIDIQYDPDVVTATDCQEEAGSVCNPDFGDAGDMVRVTGASASGHEGDTVLATITFECADAEDESPLTLIAADEEHPFADATIGAPADIDATITDGTFTCAEPEPTAIAATATKAVTVIVDTGNGGPTDTTSFGWMIVALAAIGLAGVAGFGALRVRSSR